MKTVREILETTESVITKTLKIVLSNLFKSERSRLKPFLLQVKINIYFNEFQFKINADKMLYTATYLRNYTVKWFQPVLTDYLKQKIKNQNNDTVKIFTFFKIFKD